MRKEEGEQQCEPPRLWLCKTKATSTMVLLPYHCQSQALCSKITSHKFFPLVWSNCITYLSSLAQFARVESLWSLQ
jgi:hypothetical protein